jgi:ATP-dependent RNA helicase DDX19/DBP5
MRFEKPSEIQAVTIPKIMQRRNIIAQAQTGSGKTIAFVIGMLAAIDPSQDTVQALCLAPTRELADQIVKFAVIPLSRRLEGIRYELLVPDDKGQQTKRGGVCTSHIIVGTPGKIKDLISKRYLKNLDRTVRVFVCDEADTMVDQQALGQSTLTIKNYLSPSCQILFFSATYTPQVLEYARILVKKACVVKLKTNAALVLDTIFQV